MKDKDQQEKEIKSIRERKIMLKLSDADCEKISNLCGEHNIKIADLLESFIGDLVGGTHTNGSDEREFARRYFERCWFGMDPEITLLNWLLNMGYDVYDDFLEVIDDIENGYADLEDYKKDPSVFDEEEIQFLKTDIEDWEQQIAKIKAEFLDCRYRLIHKFPSDFTAEEWKAEVENVNQFWKEKELLIRQ